jgi:EpsI family protein
MGACVLVGIVGNLIRAYSVVMIAHLSNMEYGRDHNTFGLILNGVILLAFFLVASRFGDEPARVLPGRGGVSVQQGSQRVIRYLPAGAMVVLLIITAVTPPGVLAWVDQAGVDIAEVTPGTGAQGWAVARGAVTDWEPSAPSARSHRMQQFVPEDNLQIGSAVDVSVAHFAVVGDKADQTSSLNRVYSDPWSLLSARVAGQGPNARREAVIRAPDRGMRLVWWWYRVGDAWTTSAVEAEWLTLRALLGLELPVRDLVAISTTFEADMAPAAATLAAFSRAAELPGVR